MGKIMLNEGLLRNIIRSAAINLMLEQRKMGGNKFWKELYQKYGVPSADYREEEAYFENVCRDMFPREVANYEKNVGMIRKWKEFYLQCIDDTNERDAKARAARRDKARVEKDARRMDRAKGREANYKALDYSLLGSNAFGDTEGVGIQQIPIVVNGEDVQFNVKGSADTDEFDYKLGGLLSYGFTGEVNGKRGYTLILGFKPGAKERVSLEYVYCDVPGFDEEATKRDATKAINQLNAQSRDELINDFDSNGDDAKMTVTPELVAERAFRNLMNLLRESEGGGIDDNVLAQCLPLYKRMKACLRRYFETDWTGTPEEHKDRLSMRFSREVEMCLGRICDILNSSVQTGEKFYVGMKDGGNEFYDMTILGGDGLGEEIVQRLESGI